MTKPRSRTPAYEPRIDRDVAVRVLASKVGQQWDYLPNREKVRLRIALTTILDAGLPELVRLREFAQNLPPEIQQTEEFAKIADILTQPKETVSK